MPVGIVVKLIEEILSYTVSEGTFPAFSTPPSTVKLGREIAVGADERTVPRALTNKDASLGSISPFNTHLTACCSEGWPVLHALASLWI